uniref:Dynein attachment factor N-terminal domain-containing protein n=1 Tax=Periophthalmus magnuspinnatus TaxID=409849 RepID=A0A3B4BG05_9GOBI
MSASKGLIDFGALEKELRGSLQFEEKYYRENAAKLRAVNQKVGSYDEFRSLVLASHLKPLERHDMQRAPRKQPWNPVTIGNRTHHTVSTWYKCVTTSPWKQAGGRPST